MFLGVLLLMLATSVCFARAAEFNEPPWRTLLVPITVVCECGKKITVGEKLIGKRVKCPACQQVISVPADASDDAIERPTDDESQSDGKTKAAGATKKKQGIAPEEQPGSKKKSKALLFVGLGAGLLLSCCCLGGIGVGVLYMMVSDDKKLTGTFPIEEKGKWSSKDRKTKIPNPLKAGLEVGYYVGYILPLKANTTYEFLLTQNGGDSEPYVMVENLEGLIAADAGGVPTAKVIYTPKKDGDYRIRAATLKGTGDFTLIVRELKAGPDDKGKIPGDKETGGKIILEEKGPWTKQDPIHPDTNSASKTYKANLKAGKVYSIDLVKAEQGQDPYLFLTDKEGKVLAKDDDGGGFPNARIIFTPTQDGEYQIIATNITQSLGAFRLTVRENVK
jgi:hypothetical protein